MPFDAEREAKGDGVDSDDDDEEEEVVEDGEETGDGFVIE